jgi:hypothetical protein
MGLDLDEFGWNPFWESVLADTPIPLDDDGREPGTSLTSSISTSLSITSFSAKVATAEFFSSNLTFPSHVPLPLPELVTDGGDNE